MTLRTPLIVGNWKLHHLREQAVQVSRQIAARVQPLLNRCEVGIAPVFTTLSDVEQEIRGQGLHLAAQNLYWQEQGAFTGEVSASFLKDVGCDMAIVGHSERRQLFEESNAMVAKKAHAALQQGLTPIVCVGETLSQREAGDAEKTVLSQLGAVIEKLGPEIAKTVVAYEPVWAIGTGKVATPEDAQEIHEALRAALAKVGSEVAENTRILYGGSVKPDNVTDLMHCQDIDGALVGGASLNVEDFLLIVSRGVEAR